VSDLRVVVYGAPDCCLCDDAKAVLRPAAARLGFDLVEVDITGDPRLEAAYRQEIPVVEIDGRKAFKYRVPPAELDRRIQAARVRHEGAQGAAANRGL
jgi:glutaredoxin